jgi:hypothetical protein
LANYSAAKNDGSKLGREIADAAIENGQQTSVVLFLDRNDAVPICADFG